MEFTEKLIAFIDILGFKNLVEAAEKGIGMRLDELLELLTKLGSPETRKRFAERGPAMCPQSKYLQRDLDFCITQISDCVIVSSEISPAGVINLVNHCWVAVMRLLESGIMCRGYITRGRIFHTETQVIGTGYQKAFENEGKVAAFKREADERGTPFVEVDRAVSAYVSECGDGCVKEMFSRSVRQDGELTALFPFKRLSHSFVVAGFGHPFDAEKERRANHNVRLMLEILKTRILSFVDVSNPGAIRKARHYVACLDAQITECDRTDDVITALDSPAQRQ